jgi:uncharacterized protein (TIGR01777 family)
MSGSTGLIGTAVARELEAAGHTVVRLVRRRPAGPHEVGGDPQRSGLDAAALRGAGGVIHLAGEPIAEGRWTRERKRRILESRSLGTRAIATAIAAAPEPRPVLVSASAIGYYGDRGDAVLDEHSPPGDDFLAAVCREWEGATAPAADAGARVVITRFGVVLSRAGGALARMLPFFRAGLGGRVADGGQWMSCVSLDDVSGAVCHLLGSASAAGPVNVVCPEPVTNAEFTRRLARLLRRPALLPVPRLALRLAFGELADATLLASQRIVPAALPASGYRFRHTTVEAALAAALAATPAPAPRPSRAD